MTSCTILGEKTLVQKTLRLLTIVTGEKPFAVTHKACGQRNSLVYSLLFVLNAFPVIANGATSLEMDDHSSVLIQNSCCVCLQHLARDSSLCNTIIEAGGLKSVLKLYDDNLSISRSNPDTVSRGYGDQARVHQRKIVELLQAFSCNKPAIKELFDAQRYDIIFGFMRNGAVTAKEAITAEMAERLQFLPSRKADQFLAKEMMVPLPGREQKSAEEEGIGSKEMLKKMATLEPISTSHLKVFLLMHILSNYAKYLLYMYV
jgi:hypothetical protein